MPENANYNGTETGLFGLGVFTAEFIDMIDDPLTIESDEVRSIVTTGLTFLIAFSAMIYSWINNDGMLKNVKDRQHENKLLYELVQQKKNHYPAFSNLNIPDLRNIVIPETIFYTFKQFFNHKIFCTLCYE